MTVRRLLVGAHVVLLSAATAAAQSTIPPGEPRLPSPLTSGGTYSAASIRAQCIAFTNVKQGPGDSDFRECRVSEFGNVGTVDGETYFCAIYCLIPGYTTEKGDCGDSSFIARYHRSRAPVRYTPLASDCRRWDRTRKRKRYYLRVGRHWGAIDAETWLPELVQHIPAGLETRKGAWPEIRTMRAETGLYRPGDANCCPTGGVVRARLAIRSNRFVIESLEIDRTP